MTVLLLTLAALGAGLLMLLESTPADRTHAWGWLLVVVGIGGFATWCIVGIASTTGAVA